MCCPPLLFLSCVTQPWWDPAAPSGLLCKIPNKKNVLMPLFPEFFRRCAVPVTWLVQSLLPHFPGHWTSLVLTLMLDNVL